MVLSTSIVSGNSNLNSNSSFPSLYLGLLGFPNEKKISFLQILNVSSPVLPYRPSETGDGMLDRAIEMLQRLNDRLTALNALDEQQLRRLETLEYRSG
jgi:hypothetical protein